MNHHSREIFIKVLSRFKTNTKFARKLTNGFCMRVFEVIVEDLWLPIKLVKAHCCKQAERESLRTTARYRTPNRYRQPHDDPAIVFRH